MRKKLHFILTGLFVLGLLCAYCYNLYHLVTASYRINESDLYRIGSFELLNRAYEGSDGGGGARSNADRKLIFESISRHHFEIRRDAYKSIQNIAELQTKLMHHGLIFTVYSDKETFDKYKQTPDPIFVNVSQLEIESKKYIDIPNLNRLALQSSIDWALGPPVVLLCLFFALKQKPGFWTAGRACTWLIVVTIIILTIKSLTLIF